jgi:hypothetical protein
MKTKTLYWSRVPGKFVDINTGKELVENYDSWIEVGQTFIEARPRIMVKYFQASDNFSFKGSTEEWNKGIQKIIALARTTIYQENFQLPTRFAMSKLVYERLFSYIFRWDPKEELTEAVLPSKKPVGMLLGKIIYLDPSLEEDEIVISLDSNKVHFPKKVGQFEVEEFQLPNGMTVQAPRVPDVDVELLPEIRRLAEVKIKVLDLHTV